MPEPEINTPPVPWGPLISAGVAASGASMLFPAFVPAALVATVGAGTVGISAAALGAVGGAAGWIFGKKIFSRHEKLNSEESPSPVEKTDQPEPVAEECTPCRKKWLTREAGKKIPPVSQER